MTTEETSAVKSTPLDFLPVDVVQPKRLKMTYEEFREWANEDVHAEWIDGEVIIHTPPRLT